MLEQSEEQARLRGKFFIEVSLRLQAAGELLSPNRFPSAPFSIILTGEPYYYTHVHVCLVFSEAGKVRRDLDFQAQVQ